MHLSTYQASVPVFTQMLESLSAMLDKAVAYAERKKIEPAVLLQARLAPDMLPFVSQVRFATGLARDGVARLSGVEGPSFSDNEATFDELKARVGQTLAFLQSVKPEQLEGSEERAVHLKLNSPQGPVELDFKGRAYLLHFVLPNFFFHVTTAYALLRHNGLELGKADYIHRLITG